MKKKNFLCILLVFLLMLSLFGCGTAGDPPEGEDPDPGPSEEDPTPGPSDDEEEPNPVFELVLDPLHENGFNVKGQQDGDGSWKGKLWYESEPESCSWDLAQWECGYYHKSGGNYPPEYNILNAEKTVLEDGTYQWKDASKTFRSNPQTGALWLELDAGAEYVEPRENNQPWPHLLVEYGLSQNLKVSEMQSLELQLDFELESYENLMEAGTQKEGLHTAQFLWYMTIRNNNPNSEDYGCFMWFGISLFDRRYEYSDLYAMQDTGKPINTGAYIYQPAARDILSQPTAVGVSQSVRADLLPFIRQAFQAAQNAKFFTRSKFSDLVVGGGNFGWEMTGTYHAAMSVDSFQLVATMN